VPAVHEPLQHSRNVLHVPPAARQQAGAPAHGTTEHVAPEPGQHSTTPQNAPAGAQHVPAAHV
jgi:hypothetical protein